MTEIEDVSTLVRLAAGRYAADFSTLAIEKAVDSFGRHGDIHLKARLGEKAYSVRLIGAERYRQPGHTDFVPLTDEVLADQMEYSEFLVRQGIPFMRLQRALDGSPFVPVSWNGALYRSVWFHWMDGKHITHTTANAARRMGEMARRIHDCSSGFPRRLSFPIATHVEGYRMRVQAIRDSVRLRSVSGAALVALNNTLDLAQRHIECAAASFRDDLVVVTSDLNSLNVLWDETESISGIVDFEHLAYGEQVETLAWLIKWYSRTSGITSHEVSPLLAEQLLRGYGADTLLNEADYERLSSLLWLSGCMNGNFVQHTLHLLQNGSPEQLEDHLERYRRRGEALTGLLGWRTRNG